jgi:hypothetical protein
MVISILLFSKQLFSQVPDTNIKSDTVMIVSKSPGSAAIRSAILPGLGQFCNESYWKIPIIYSVGAFFIYEYIHYDKDFKHYSDRFEASKAIYGPDGYRLLKEYREYYRDLRDSFIWYFGLLYLVNIVDAYVDAHLYNFNVNNNLSFKINPFNNKYQFKIQFSF